MTVCPWRTWTREPAAGTFPPSQVAGADHGPLCAERMAPGPSAPLPAARTRDESSADTASTTAVRIGSAVRTARGHDRRWGSLPTVLIIASPASLLFLSSVTVNGDSP